LWRCRDDEVPIAGRPGDSAQFISSDQLCAGRRADSDFLNIMGDKVGRVALLGISLQQQWSNRF
jgi:hypothetical protein